MTVATGLELNQTLRFDKLTLTQQQSFNSRPTPVLVRLPGGTHLYKWTQYPLINNRGFASEYWSSWQPMTVEAMRIPGFSELRKRYRNRDGEVGRPQEFMRARNAVTDYWNNMESITKAELRLPVWGFIGVCAPQPVSKSEEQSRRVLFIGGEYQLVLPNMQAQHIFKL